MGNNGDIEDLIALTDDDGKSGTNITFAIPHVISLVLLLKQRHK